MIWGLTELAEKLSIIELILNASLVVQLVMALLVMASVTSWVMIFQRAFVLNYAFKATLNFEERFWSGMDLGKLFRDANQDQVAAQAGLVHIFCAGFKEFSRLKQQTEADPEAIMQGVERTMRIALAREEEKLETHLAFLATVGSISPYIGLFGTVWGIMNSFRDLANVSQASLSTVAPGISEALIATAMGLFAAIPAVIAYNRYSSRVEALVNRYDTFADEFSSILHRNVHVSRG